jgi:gliding motility-associated-like protein
MPTRYTVNILFFLGIFTLPFFGFSQGPVPDVTGDTTICIGQSTILSATISPPDASSSIRWYDATGLVLLSTGPSYTVGPIVTNTAVYVQRYKSITDFSTKKRVDIYAKSNLDAPTATYSPASICPGSTVTITGVSTNGSTIFKWYSSAIAVTPIHTGHVYSPALSTTTSFYLETEDANGCISARSTIPIVVLPVTVPPTAIASPATICPGSTSTITASATGTVANYRWYDAATGGTLLFTGNPYTASPTTTGLNSFYVQSEDNNGCFSILVQVNVTVLPAVSFPVGTASPATVCIGSSSTLAVTTSNGTSSYEWFDALTAGNSEGTGTSISVSPSTTKTYYLQETDGDGCVSVRSPVLVTVIPALTLPVGTASPAIICAGASSTLAVTTPNGTSTYSWYDAITAGSVIGTGTSITVSQTSTTTYYLEETDNGGCISLRTPITVIVAPSATIPIATAAPATICPGETSILTGTSTDSVAVYRWYDTITAGPLLDTGNPYSVNPSVSTNYYVEAEDTNGCTSVRTLIRVTVVPNADIPLASATPSTACPGQTFSLSASSINGSTVFKWFDALIGGTLLHTGSVYTTTVSTTTTFYVGTENANGCESLRTAVIIIVLPNLDIPVATASPSTICAGETVTLTGVSPAGFTVFNWYDALSGGNLLHTGSTYTTTVNTTTAFYLETENATGCKSVRTPVIVAVTPNLDVPIATASPSTICPGEAVTLSAISTNGSTVFMWYDALTAGNLLHTGSTYSTTVNTTTTFYVGTENGTGCASVRTPVVVTVLTNLDAPVASSSPSNVCPNQTFTLSATSINGSTVFNWYDAITGGNFLATGTSYTTSSPTTTTYYVESANGQGCLSPRTAVIVIVIPNTDVPVATSNPSSVCPDELFTLSATSINGSSVFNWYDALTGGALLHSGTNYNSSTSSTAIYYVASVNAQGCESPLTPVTVTVIPNPDVPVATASPAIVCPGESVTLTGTSINGSSVFKWYDALTGGNLLHTGSTFTTSVSSTTTFYLQSQNATGCASLRTPVIVTVAPNADVPIATASPSIICPGESFTLTGTSINGSTTFNWSDALTGGNLLHSGSSFTTSANNTTIYFLETEDGSGCASLRTPVTVVVVPNADVPVASSSATTVCPNESFTLTGSSINGSTVFNWYNAVSGGNLLHSGASFTTSTTSTTIYYLETENAQGCVSSRTPIIITVVPNADVPLGTATPSTVCPNESVTLTGTSINGSIVFNWYDAITGGTLLHTGSTYTTSVTGTTTFYLESENAQGCASLRTAVLVTVLPNADVPVASSSPTSVCPNESFTLSATSINGSTTFNWSDALTGGNLLSTGATYTSSTSSTTAYYVESENSQGCASLRTAVVVTVLPNLDVPVATASPTTVCPDETFTLTGASINGSTIFRWYDALTGGNLLQTGSTYSTSTSSTTTYYLESENTQGCTSVRTPVIVTIVPNLDVPVATATPSTVCPGETVTLTGNSVNGSTIFKWYDALTGGTLLNTGATYTTTVSTTSTFYLESTNSNGCASLRTPVIVIVLPNGDIPVASATPSSVCPNESVTLSANSINGSTIFKWYDALTGGTLLHTGITYTTTASTTTIFYVESENTNGCTSVRTPVVVTVLPNLDVPVATVTPSTVCPGENFTLSASSLNGSTVFNWYDALIGGTLLQSGVTFTTSTSTTTIYYLESVNANGCKSLRTPVTVTVLPNADIPIGTATPTVACPGESVTFAATSINGSIVFNWYTAITGGTLVHSGANYTTTVNATTTYYIESENGTGCTSVRTPVLVTVLPNLDVPIASPAAVTSCPNQSYTLTASSINGSTVFNWYDALTGGALLHTGSTFTNSSATTTTIFLESENSSGCKSVRSPILVTIVPNLDVPVATPASVCPGESVTLSAISINGSTIFKWYDALTGGTLLHTGASYTTNVSTTTTYYVQSENADGCASLRTPVIVTVLPDADIPVATASPTTVCPNESFTLTASSISGSTIFNWYNAIIGGTLLHTGATYTTTTTTTTIYYVESVNSGGCASLRTPVAVVVIPNADIPLPTAVPVTVCPGESFTITGTSINGSTIFRWYDAITGGTLLFTGNPFTNTVSATTIFYLETENTDGCTSIRTLITITVLPNLDIPIGTPDNLTVCPDDSVYFTGTSINGSTSFKWYDAITGGSLLFTGNPYGTTVSTTTTVFVESINSTSCTSLRTAALVTVVPNLDIPVATVSPVSGCPDESVTMTATSINGSTVFEWYDALIGGNLLHTGASYTTTVPTTTTYYVQSVDSNGCKSIRTPVIVTILPSTDVPVGTASPLTVCPDQSVTLTATSPSGATVFEWYDAMFGGTLLHSGPSYTTTVSTTTTFYVQSVNGTGCASLRTLVIAVVTPFVDVPVGLASPATICPGETVVLSATSPTGATIFGWYDSILDGNLLHSTSSFSTTVSSTTIFYLQTENGSGCASVRTPVLVTVLPNLDVPIASPNPIIACPDEMVTFTGSSLNSSPTFRWYNALTGGNLVETGASFDTSITSTTIFYLESESSNGCISVRTPATITVVPSIDVPVGLATPFTVCPGQTVNFSATSITGAVSFNWYDALIAGSLVKSAASFDTIISATTTFYVSTESSDGCQSIRIPVIATVLPNLDVPVATSSPLTVCPDESVTLSATSINGSTIFRWYDAITGGTLLHTGVNYTTSVSATTIIYLESENSTGCVSLRTPVTITVLPNIDVPLATSTPSTLCPNETFTLSGSSITASTIFNWYDALIEGTLLHTGATYTSSVSTTTIFYIETESASGCKSIRTPVTVLILPNLDAPIATSTPATVCSGETVTMSASSLTGSTIFEWFDALIGGTSLHVGSTYSTSISTTSIFYVQSESANGCASARTPVIVTVLPNLDIPVATADKLTVCPGETVTFSVTSLTGSTVFNWSDALVGGTLLHTGSTYPTTVSTTSVFYVESVNSNGCVSLRTPVTITVLPNIDVPVAVASPLLVCQGEPLTLSATSINGSTIFNWYDAITGGNLLHTGASYSISVSSTTIFYVESENSNGCLSVRTPVSATVVPNIDIPVGTASPLALCSGETVTLSATSLTGNTIFNWYAAITGGSLLHTGATFVTAVSATTIFYIESQSSDGCVSLRTPVTAIVVPNIDVPVATANPISSCPGQNVLLTAISLTGSSIFEWSDALLAGNLLNTGSNFNVSPSATTIYYVQSINSDGCASLRTPVTVLVLPNIDVPVATASPATICPGAAVTLTANSLTGSIIFNWYNALIGGTLLHVGATYSPMVSTTTIFYVESENSAGCLSLRTPVIVTVLPNLDIPIATSSPLTVCPNQPVTLTAMSITGSTIFNWYDALIGGNLLHTGSTFTTSATSTTVLYLESVSANGCTSIRTPVTITILPNLDIPIAISNPLTVCPGENVILSATSITGSIVFKWYDTLLGGTLLHTGTTFNTSVNATTIFYVQSENANGCASIRTPVTVTVIPNIDVPIGTAFPLIACAGESVTLSATSITGSSIFKWYDALVGGNLLHVGQSYTTSANSTTIVYLQSETITGCASLRTPVTINIIPNIDVPVGLASPLTTCANEDVTLSATSITGSTTYKWYDALLGGILLHTGTTYTISVSSTTIFYVSSINSGGCESIRTPVTVVILPNLDVPLATSFPLAVCSGEAVNFSATSINGSVIFNWYNTLVAGNILHTGPTYSPTVTASTLFYLESINSDGCASLRTAVTALVLPNLDVPMATASSATVCPNDSVTLSGNSINNAPIFKWYDNIVGGNLLHIGQTFPTTVSTTTIFYLETENASGCESVRTPLAVVVIPNLDIPLATASPSIICPNDTTNLSVVSTNGSGTFSWYDSIVSGNLIYTGSTFDTALVNTTTFYAQSEQSSGCASNRIPITVVVQPNLDVPVGIASPFNLCLGDSTLLTASSLNGSTSFNWFDSPTGGAPIFNTSTGYQTLTTTTTFYVESVNSTGCKSALSTVIVSVIPNLDVPSANANPAVVCEGGVTNITASSANGLPTFVWYDSITGGSQIFNGSVFSPTILNDTTIYVSSENASGCPSVRTAVTITVAPNNDSPQITATPTILCSSDSSLLSGTSSNGSTTFIWYDTTVGGSIIHTGQNYTPFVVSTTSYYLETRNANNCASVRDTQVVLVDSNNDIPTALANPSIVCPGQTTLLTGGSPAGFNNYRWSDSITGGSVLFNGPIFAPTINSDTTFFIETENTNGCLSIRTAVIVTVNPNTDSPTIQALPAEVCAGESSTLTATSSNGSSIFNWFTTSTGGTTFSTVNPTVVYPISNTWYFVATKNSTGCVSKRDSFEINIGGGPNAFIVNSDTSICAGETLDILAGSDSSNIIFKWYLTNGGTLLGQGQIYNVTPENTMTIYMAGENESGCTSQVDSMQITVNDQITLAAPTVDCENPSFNEVLFTWNIVSNADGYEISLDNGQTWIDNGSKTSHLFANLDSEEKVSLTVRAYYDGNEPCTDAIGAASPTKNCEAERFDADDIEVPYNTFSPNGDGSNEFWHIGDDVPKFPDNEVVIFNRIGEEVFSTVGYDNMDNVFIGEDLADGSYYYIVRIPSVHFVKSGFVILTR